MPGRHRRRRRGTRKGARRRTARRAYTGRRKSRNNFGPSKLGLFGKLAVTALGTVAAEVLPPLNNKISENIPVSWGGALGLLLFMRGKGQTLAYFSPGLMLGGGAYQAVKQLAEPTLSKIKLAA